MTNITPKPEHLAQLVFPIRGGKGLLDADLAMLYGVETGALNRAVERNLDRFPCDFMFQLCSEDWENLKCQIGISSASAAVSNGKKSGSLRSQIVAAGMHGGRRGLPYAFSVFDAIKQLIADDQTRKAKPKRSIGFL